MNRSPWNAVLWTVIVMVAAAFSTYLPWHRIAPPVTHATASAWSRASSRACAWFDERRFVLALAGSGRAAPAALPASAWAVAAGTAGLAATAIAWTRRGRPRRRPRVLRMAGAGADVAAIARQSGLAQDAVRLMLSPMVDPARSGARRGTSFRKQAAATAGRPALGRGRASAG